MGIYFFIALIKEVEATHIRHRFRPQVVLFHLILSPFGPIIIHYLRKHHFNPVIIKRLALFNLRHKIAPKYDEEYENEETMNLYRWMKIQKYRHSTNSWYAFFTSLLWALVTYHALEAYLPLGYRFIFFIMGAMSMLSVFLQAMVYQNKWPYLSRECVFVQSYWLNVATTGMLEMYQITCPNLMMVQLHSL